MTFLRMLAFRPTSGEVASGSTGGSVVSKPPAKLRKPVAAVTETKSAPTKVAAEAWQDPDWGQLVPKLGVSGAVRLLASNCAFLRRDGNTVYLGLDPRSESLLTKQRKATLAELLSSHFGEQLLVDVALGAETSETPVQQESRMADERMEAARQELEADPNVQAMKNIFGAEIKTETIELINPSRSD
jgi:DNA polymerase-3 subunit gamma/tau